jgi:L,D-peptidoglycan transpeptidase YkuD (ErfK/YbiS/YcfS/YnhG family)
VRRGRAAVVGPALLATTLALGLAPAGAATAPPYHPSRLTSIGAARQVVVVTAADWQTSHATLRTYERRADGGWRAVLPAVRARIGGRGFALAANRRQGSAETPAGTFRLPRAFGRYADPGTRMPYRRFDRNDWWPYDPRSPRTYNVFQTRRVAGAPWRTSWAEHLWSYGGQYRHGVIVGFNLPSGVHRSGGQWVARRPADTRKGGGIFLHVNGPGSTAGCISVPYDRMRAILRWLDPAKGPRIVMGPTAVITRM